MEFDMNQKDKNKTKQLDLYWWKQIAQFERSNSSQKANDIDQVMPYTKRDWSLTIIVYQDLYLYQVYLSN